VYSERTFAKDYLNPTNSPVEEQAVQCLRYPNIEKYASTTNPEYDILVKYIREYNDYLLKMDQERLMILGAIEQLRESNTKFIIVDLIGKVTDMDRIKNPRTLADTNVMNIIDVDPYISIPLDFRQHYANPSDDFHFNQEGNIAIAKLFIPKIKEILDIRY
jgi:lysophospholipase L1-like esterase